MYTLNAKILKAKRFKRFWEQESKKA